MLLSFPLRIQVLGFIVALMLCVTASAQTKRARHHGTGGVAATSPAKATTPAKTQRPATGAPSKTTASGAGMVDPGATETFTAPTFGRVSVYAPSGPPSQVVLFVSGDGGWNLGVIPMAQRLRDLGALVVGLDIRTFLKNLEQPGGCAYPAGPLEELSRAVQIRRKLPAYLRPILVGYSSGATLVYAALAAAPPETFAGAISLGFCPDLEMHTPPCHMRGLTSTKKPKALGFDLGADASLSVPWMVLQGDIDQVCAPEATKAFVAKTGSGRLFRLTKVGHGFAVTRRWEPQYVEAYQAIVAASSAERTRPSGEAGSGSRPPAGGGGAARSPKAEDERDARDGGVELSDLSLIEVPPTGGAAHGEMAVILSGDGGWAELDKSVAAKLAAAGVPTVGWSSLRYFWTPRTPERAATDLARIISHYVTAWRAPRVLLIGYSFGADALPFLVSRLPLTVRSHISRVALLGLSETAAFEFHVADWLGGGGASRYRTVPEVEQLGLPVTCVHGADEDDSACRDLKGPHITVASVGQGHHFGGDYARVVDLLLRQP